MVRDWWRRLVESFSGYEDVVLREARKRSKGRDE